MKRILSRMSFLEAVRSLLVSIGLTSVLFFFKILEERVDFRLELAKFEEEQADKSRAGNEFLCHRVDQFTPELKIAVETCSCFLQFGRHDIFPIVQVCVLLD